MGLFPRLNKTNNAPRVDLKLKTAAASMPLSTAEVKEHLRVNHSAEDNYIGNLIEAAFDACREYTGRALMPETWELSLDYWPYSSDHQHDWWDGVREMAIFSRQQASEVKIPLKPLISVVKIDQYADDGTATEYSSDNYHIDLAGNRVVLKKGVAAPQGGRSFSPIVIEFTAGYADADAVPRALKWGMLEFIAFKFEHRGDDLTTIPPNIYPMIEKYRVIEL